MRRILAGLLAGLLCLMGMAQAEGLREITVTVDLSAPGKPISPLIYGVNQTGEKTWLRSTHATAIRQGGNRWSAYNWETNASSAGSDWRHSSDGYLSNSAEPAEPVLRWAREAAALGIPYRLATLQLMGYAAADRLGTVRESEAAPSARWVEVLPDGGDPARAEPDLTDGRVYLDEFVGRLIAQLGDSSSPEGIRGYSLDNEPALWEHTHVRAHPGTLSVDELLEKSVAAARMVKRLDPGAEVFGPALYGYTAYDHLSDEQEWKRIRRANGYRWFLDCYLDRMREAGEEAGVRLLDVLDIHYYSESARVSAEDRVQAARTLTEPGFYENSWIGQWCRQNLPLLPTVQASIDRYYPGTKLAISEYNFGGDGDPSGAIVQVEALGAFADAGVYFAALWGGEGFIVAGLNLYTNYDGQGARFAPVLLPSETSDIAVTGAWAAADEDRSRLTVALTNKSEDDDACVTLDLRGAERDYPRVRVWGIEGASPVVRELPGAAESADGVLRVTLPPWCAALVELRSGEE